ncbi:hypothetical protein Mithridates_00119 [Acinetobacter phage Mithridates]|nr:hypothetical protein Mithridates_00119 [Acinetobacter phage Mithridates]
MSEDVHTRSYMEAVEHMQKCENALLEAINKVFEEYSKMNYFLDSYLNMSEALKEIKRNFNDLIDKVNNFNLPLKKLLTKNFSIGKVCYILKANAKIDKTSGLTKIDTFSVFKINLDGSESIVLAGDWYE